MKKICFLLMLFFSYIQLSDAVADDCGCDSALMNGVFNYRYERGDIDSIEAVKHLISQSSFEEFERSVSANASFADFIRKGLFGYDESKYKEKHRQLQKEYSKYNQLNYSSEILEKYGDVNVLSAWSTCKVSCIKDKPSRTGLQHALEVLDEDNFRLHIFWTPVGGAKAIVRESFIEGGAVFGRNDNKIFNNDELIDQGGPNFDTAGTTRDIKRTSTGPVRIHIQIPGMDITEYIPKKIDVAVKPASGAPYKPWKQQIDFKYCEEKKVHFADSHRTYYGDSTWSDKTTPNKYIGWSDTKTVVNHYMLCTYELPRPIKKFKAQVNGGEIHYSGTLGNGGGLHLLFYKDQPNASINTWDGNGGASKVYSWPRYKGGAKNPNVEQRTIRFDFDSEINTITVGVLLRDAWAGTAMTIMLNEPIILEEN